MITIGALVTLIGGAVVSRLFMEWSWSLACVFGSLVIVTGPTVVVPILKRVRLTRRLHFIVKSEGILIDAVGAVAAVVTLEYVVALKGSLQDTLIGFGARLGTGAIVGAGVAGLAALLWWFPVFHEHDNLLVSWPHEELLPQRWQVTFPLNCNRTVLKERLKLNRSSF